MKPLILALSSLTVILSGCATTSKTAYQSIDTSGLSIVSENTATLKFDGVAYNLKSYIKPFQQPYYVSVSRVDNKAISNNQAASIAKKYIQPRGCTQSIILAPSLDQSNANQTQWIIGILC